MMLKIYHNPQCKRSRAGLEYLKERLNEQQVEKLLTKLNKKPHEVVRTQEKYFKTSLKGKHFNHHEWVRIIVENPRLLMRPIIEREYKAVIGDPLENIDLIIKRT